MMRAKKRRRSGKSMAPVLLIGGSIFAGLIAYVLQDDSAVDTFFSICTELTNTTSNEVITGGTVGIGYVDALKTLQQCTNGDIVYAFTWNPANEGTGLLTKISQDFSAAQFLSSGVGLSSVNLEEHLRTVSELAYSGQAETSIHMVGSIDSLPSELQHYASHFGADFAYLLTESAEKIIPGAVLEDLNAIVFYNNEIGEQVGVSDYVPEQGYFFATFPTVEDLHSFMHSQSNATAGFYEAMKIGIKQLLSTQITSWTAAADYVMNSARIAHANLSSEVASTQHL